MNRNEYNIKDYVRKETFNKAVTVFGIAIGILTVAVIFSFIF